MNHKYNFDDPKPELTLKPLSDCGNKRKQKTKGTSEFDSVILNFYNGKNNTKESIYSTKYLKTKHQKFYSIIIQHYS